MAEIAGQVRQLAGIQEAEDVCPPAKNGDERQVRTALTKMNADQPMLLELLALDQHTV